MSSRIVYCARAEPSRVLYKFADCKTAGIISQRPPIEFYSSTLLTSERASERERLFSYFLYSSLNSYLMNRATISLARADHWAYGLSSGVARLFIYFDFFIIFVKTSGCRYVTEFVSLKLQVVKVIIFQKTMRG